MTACIPPPPKTLFTLGGTPVRADFSAPLNPAGALALCWLLAARRYAGRAWPLRLLVSALWTALFSLAYLVHSLGHLLSARLGGAPVDALLVNAFNWSTVYHDDHVAPRQHIWRAAGGPLASLGALALAWTLRPSLPPGLWGRDLGDAFAALNALIGAAALLPAPSFDGGALLKWALYARMGDLGAARRAVSRAGLGASVLLTALSALALRLRRPLVGMALATFSLVAALESLRRD